MRANEWYFFLLTLSFGLATLALSSFQETQLDIYISAYILEYLILTLLMPLNSKTSRILDYLGYALTIVFVVIVIMNVWEIIFGSSL
jgi:Ca2+/Na+ antiporter